ncbi:MAG: AAA family ATPase [Burkholderiaceae bacterium]
MSEASQQPVITWLADPRTHGGAVTAVEQITTHGARVFLAGDRVFKIKRAVRYPYMDFSTLDKRRAACERELQINQPAAPMIYRAVTPITREADGSFAFEGAGPVCEWALSMHRFDQACLLENIAREGPLAPALVEALATAVAHYHRQAPVIADGRAGERLDQVVDGLHAFFSTDSALDAKRRKAFGVGLAQAAQQLRDLVIERGRQGLVRRGHGDLHLANVAVIDTVPVLFDAIEFDERLATVDVLHDLAFLLMDLAANGQPVAANRLLNGYLTAFDDPRNLPGLRALPLFLALRAAVRAMVACQQGGDGADARAARYFEAACQALADRPARLVAVGGLSGSGKSTVAAALCPGIGRSPGALLLRSDIERKALFGVRPTDRLPSQAYVAGVSAAVYARLRDKAAVALAAGHSVVLDAVFSDEHERANARALAHKAGVPFTGLFLQAPAEALIERVQARRGDASDADAQVVRLQLAQGIGPLDWLRVDAGGSPAQTLAAARALL